MLITVGTVVLIVIRSALAGYVLGRYDFPGKKRLIAVFLITFFLPEGYTIIPVTQLTDQLGLLNTHAGVILGLGAGGQSRRPCSTPATSAACRRSSRSARGSTAPVR